MAGIAREILPRGKFIPAVHRQNRGVAKRGVPTIPDVPPMVGAHIRGAGRRGEMSDLILRSASSRVSKDEWHERGRMVRDGAKAPPHHEV